MSDEPKTRKTPIYREMAGSPMYLGQSSEMSDAKGEFVGWHEEPVYNTSTKANTVNKNRRIREDMGLTMLTIEVSAND